MSTVNRSLPVADLPEFLTVDQVSQYLGVSKNTVYTWCSEGVLTSFKVGNTRRIRKEAFAKLINDNSSTKEANVRE